MSVINEASPTPRVRNLCVGAAAMTLEEILAAQQASFREDPAPDADTREDRLDRLSLMLSENAELIADALESDYGSRLRMWASSEIGYCVAQAAYAKMNLVRWMRPSKQLRAVPGLSQTVIHDPLGVVGIIGPWNFPVMLTMSPAVDALAAGNRVMIRPSSVTAATMRVLADIAPKYFDVTELAVVTAEHGQGADFSKLKFDSVFFTGSPGVGASVAQDAAANLVPATLELGGKNPVIVHPSADMAKAGTAVARSRLAHSGQICLSPDYVFVPGGRVQEFIDTVTAVWREDTAPGIQANPSYTAIVNDSNYRRILGLLDDAQTKGAHISQIIPDGEVLPDPDRRKIPPTLVSGVTPEMEIDAEEVFGPVLIVHEYDSLDEPVRHIGARELPLTMYWYGPRNGDFEAVVAATRTGSVNVNDFMMNMAFNLPFGGVGASGSGRYHGYAGFCTFTNERAIAAAARPWISPVSMRIGGKLIQWVTSSSYRLLGSYSRRLRRRI